MKKYAIFLSIIFLFLSVNLFAAEIEIGENEVKLGKESAEEIAKMIKVVTDEAMVNRVNTIGKRIAEIANRDEVYAFYGSSEVVPFEYSFTIVEDEEVNAYSVPGGFIYVHTGLLDYVQSDDELAGVLAHEITHVSHHHMVYLLKQQAKISNVTTIAMLATMLLGGNSANASNIILGVQLFQIAKLNGYGMDAERDADYAAIDYMIKAGYNPVGLLTFLERLAKNIELVDYGIYRNHPIDSERVASAKRIINEKGIKINRRATVNAICAEVKVENDRNNVYLLDKIIYTPAGSNGLTAEAVAVNTANTINALLDENIKAHEVKYDSRGGVSARNRIIADISDEDAKLMGKSKAEIAKGIQTVIRNVLFKQMVDTLH